MLELWRLTRTPYGRAVYDWFARRGLTAARMHEYVAHLDGDPPAASLPGDLELAVVDAPSATGDHEHFAELAADEVVVAARNGDRHVGHLFVSADHERYVDPLEQRQTFPGAYVRRVFVDSEHRNRGVASGLLARALGVAADRFDAETAHALVAVDNRPSQWLFESAGFEVRRTHAYYRAFDWSHRSTTERDDRTNDASL